MNSIVLKNWISLKSKVVPLKQIDRFFSCFFKEIVHRICLFFCFKSVPYFTVYLI